MRLLDYNYEASPYFTFDYLIDLMYTRTDTCSHSVPVPRDISQGMAVAKESRPSILSLHPPVLSHSSPSHTVAQYYKIIFTYFNTL